MLGTQKALPILRKKPARLDRQYLIDFGNVRERQLKAAVWMLTKSVALHCA